MYSSMVNYNRKYVATIIYLDGFTMDERKVIQSLLSQFEKERDQGNRALKQLPRGVLRLTRNGPGRISIFREYNYEGKRKRKGIRRDEPLIYQLAHKAYLQEKLRRLNSNIETLKHFGRTLESLDPEDILRSLPAHYDMLDAARVIDPRSDHVLDYPRPVYDGSVPPRRVTLTTGGLAPQVWAELPYCANTKHMERLIHRTGKGVRFRSKGEGLSLEKYDALHLFYHYDEVIEINGQYRSPDGILARRDRKLIFHEHAGMRDDGYREDLMDKLALYASAGIRLGENLIVTFDDEKGGVNMELVEAMLRDRMFS